MPVKAHLNFQTFSSRFRSNKGPKGAEILTTSPRECLRVARCYYQHRPWRLKMTRLSLVVAAASAWLAFGPQPAAADYYGAPWCAVVAAGAGGMEGSVRVPPIRALRRGWLAG